MLSRRIKDIFSPEKFLFQLVASIGAGFILSAAILAFSPLLTLGIVCGLLMLYVVLKRPEIAVIGIIIATSSIVFEGQLPRISVGISFHLSDVFLLGLLGIAFIRSLVETGFRYIRTPLDLPILLLVGFTILSTLIAVFQSSVEAEPARRAIRVFSYYLIFFGVTQLIRERRQLNLLLIGILLIAIVVAIAMVVQFAVGSSIRLLPGRVEGLVTQDAAYDDITRILAPGWSTIMIAFVALICLLAFEKKPVLAWIYIFLLLLFGLALTLTFLRSYWAALIGSISLLPVLFKGKYRTRFFSGIFAILALVSIVLLLVLIDPDSRAARLVYASSERLGTLGNVETFQGRDSSLNWRLIENEYAMASIMEHPLIGLGMSSQYRPLDFRLDYINADWSITDLRRYIHNGHLQILLQSGVLGYACFIWLSILFMARGFKFWHGVPDGWAKSVVLGNLIVYLAILVAATVNPTFMEWRWTPLFGVMFGTNEVIYQLNYAVTSQSPAPAPVQTNSIGENN